MPRFFHECTDDGTVITGQDAVHIRRALRMQVGDSLTLCDGQGMDYDCKIDGWEGDGIRLTVDRQVPNASEPSTVVTLYQGLPKSDKMEWIVQKAVELGVTAIVPVVTSRSIARMDEKAGKKQERWQKIAAEAAGQCGRGIIPMVSEPLSWKQALAQMNGENVITFYEGGGEPLNTLVSTETRQISIVIGPEGGFASEEVDQLRKQGAQIATLGKRILRCETAPLAALAILMQLTGNME